MTVGHRSPFMFKATEQVGGNANASFGWMRGQTVECRPQFTHLDLCYGTALPTLTVGKLPRQCQSLRSNSVIGANGKTFDESC